MIYFKMKNLLFITLIFIFNFSFGQPSDEDLYTLEIKIFQEELNTHYANADESPLTKENFRVFKALNFFPINPKYKVRAKLEKAHHAVPFGMPTTTDRKPEYRVYGVLHFTIDSVQHELTVYQNTALIKKEKYKDFLFLPFGDLSNGKKSYGGGRYLDLTKSDSDVYIVDFNKAYHPYCAYNHKYSCPMIPQENILKIWVNAGVQSGFQKK